MEPTPQGAPNRTSFSFWRIVAVVVPLAILCVVAMKVTAMRIVDEAQKKSEETMLAWFELGSPTPRELNPRFVDADHDLVADPPKNATEQISPDKLIFSYVAGPDAKEELAAWQELAAHIAKSTDRPVEAVAFSTSRDQLAALAKGALHITGFNTGTVPAAVTSCGFVPVCTMGRTDGTFGVTMSFIVPAGSKIQELQDLKRGTVAFTTRDSNSGCKAALALLQDHNLLPMRDYLWKFSGGHDESIKGVVEGDYQAAPVASDLLQRAIATHEVSATDIRTIYESERFPPATLGYIYYLSPDLASRIRQALLEYDPSGTELGKHIEASGATRFVPVSYKQDFALVRRIDSAFRTPATADRD
jgi:phosphonate transport system substrate-binding protein